MMKERPVGMTDINSQAISIARLETQLEHLRENFDQMRADGKERAAQQLKNYQELNRKLDGVIATLEHTQQRYIGARNMARFLWLTVGGFLATAAAVIKSGHWPFK